MRRKCQEEQEGSLGIKLEVWRVMSYKREKSWLTQGSPFNSVILHDEQFEGVRVGFIVFITQSSAVCSLIP